MTSLSYAVWLRDLCASTIRTSCLPPDSPAFHPGPGMRRGDCCGCAFVKEYKSQSDWQHGPAPFFWPPGWPSVWPAIYFGAGMLPYLRKAVWILVSCAPTASGRRWTSLSRPCFPALMSAFLSELYTKVLWPGCCSRASKCVLLVIEKKSVGGNECMFPAAILLKQQTVEYKRQAA